MKDTKLTKEVAGRRAGMLAVVSLLAGIAGGWTIHHAQRGAEAVQRIAPVPVSSKGQPEEAAQMKQAADAQAGPLLERLKTEPANADVLIRLGNLYYDAQQYPLAVDYYHRALNVQPANASVRTDMATAYWYMGSTDSALAEFNKALAYEPNNPNTLFNLGLVRWKGKRDAAGALGDWQKLLAANPNYDGKDKVTQMIAEVRSAQK